MNALRECPICSMHLREAADPRMSGMLEHPPNLHCPISALCFIDTPSMRAAWNRRPADGWDNALVAVIDALQVEQTVAGNNAASYGLVIAIGIVSGLPRRAATTGRETREAVQTAFNALTYPVSTEIDPKGYSLRIDRDEVGFAAETLFSVLNPEACK